MEPAVIDRGRVACGLFEAQSLQETTIRIINRDIERSPETSLNPADPDHTEVIDARDDRPVTHTAGLDKTLQRSGAKSQRIVIDEVESVFVITTEQSIIIGRLDLGRVYHLKSQSLGPASPTAFYTQVIHDILAVSQADRLTKDCPLRRNTGLAGSCWPQNLWGSTSNQ